MMEPFEGVSGRFTDLPQKLRQVKELISDRALLSDGQWLYIRDVLEDGAMKIEALERETVSETD
jgi:hypothetical protein